VGCANKPKPIAESALSRQYVGKPARRSTRVAKRAGARSSWGGATVKKSFVAGAIVLMTLVAEISPSHFVACHVYNTRNTQKPSATSATL